MKNELTPEEKSALLAEFERPKVVQKSPSEIEEQKEIYIQIVANFALEDAEPIDFYKIIAMEKIRGELTEEQATSMILNISPKEEERINKKIERLKALGLSWKDL